MSTKRTIKHLIFQLINPTFTYDPREGIKSLKRKLLFYFFVHPGIKKRYIDEIEFIRNKSNDTYSYIFPYPFILDYSFKDISVFKDENLKLFYVLHGIKKLYFSQKFDSIKKVKVAYYCALIEQDKNSPHRYLNESFDIKQNDVVLDVGAAEGLLGLENIDKIKKLYVFEADSDWIDALKATFEPWKDKVEIIHKYVSDINTDTNISLDAYLKELKVNLIKIDVEGVEKHILAGAHHTLSKTEKVAICTYHNQKDEKLFKELLLDYGFQTSYSAGYMLFILKKLYPPYFRKGLIRGVK